MSGGWHVVAMDHEECLSLLGRAPVGRVVVTVDALPVACTVPFVLERGSVTFPLRTGSRLWTDTQDTVVAFHVDEYDVQTHESRSVLVYGVAEEVSDRQGDLRRSVPTDRTGVTDDPDADSELSDRLMRIPLTVIRGERVRFPAADRPSR